MNFNMRFYFIVLTVIVVLFKHSECARILGIFTMPGISHNILTSKLMRALVAAGHDVTMISPFPMKDVPKNGTLNDIVLEGFFDKMHANNMFALHDQNLFQVMFNMNKVIMKFSNDTVHHPKVQRLLKSDQKFDALILEQFMNDALKVFAYIYDCPLILLSSMGPNSWVNSYVGNEGPVSYVANIMKGDFSTNLSLVNRGFNLMYNLLDAALRSFILLPAQDVLMHQWYPDAPPLEDLNTNVSIMLLNSHTSLYPPLPLVPNMVEIGGYFIDPPGKLPVDLQEVLDQSTEGVIFFSMGSNLKSKNLPERKKQAIICVLGRLKMKVLWKFEEDLPSKPNNVIIRSWFSQQDILAHPNTKLFITHGGLLSTTEAVHHGVPLLAVPVYGDQDANADRAVHNGYGLKVSFSELNEENLEKSIKELLTNPVYKENVVQISKIYHDRPEHPLKTAVYWVEYVIRHKGAQHLKIAGLKLPWYKYYMVDVFAAIFLLMSVTIKILKLVFSRVYCIVCGKSSSIGPKQKTN